jgi:hypothetical protein
MNNLDGLKKDNGLMANLTDGVDMQARNRYMKVIG